MGILLTFSAFCSSLVFIYLWFNYFCFFLTAEYAYRFMREQCFVKKALNETRSEFYYHWSWYGGMEERCPAAFHVWHYKSAGLFSLQQLQCPGIILVWISCFLLKGRTSKPVESRFDLGVNYLLIDFFLHCLVFQLLVCIHFEQELQYTFIYFLILQLWLQ